MGTVVVASKHPSGIHLDLREQRLVTDEKGNKSLLPTPGATAPRRVTLNGAAFIPGEPREYPIVGGYAMTEVDEDFWNEWVDKVGRHLDMYNSGMIFASPKPAEVQGRAREQKDEKTGLEGLDPNRPGEGLEETPGGNVKSKKQ